MNAELRKGENLKFQLGKTLPDLPASGPSTTSTPFFSLPTPSRWRHSSSLLLVVFTLGLGLRVSAETMSEQGPIIHSILPSHETLTPSNLVTNTTYAAKPDLLKSLSGIQKRQIEEISNLDERTKKFLKESTEVSLQSADAKGAALKLKVIIEAIDKIARSRLEYNARRQFIDQLNVTIDSKWTSQPLRDFLTSQLLEMAIVELATPTPDVKTATFLIYLSVAIREIAEPRENLIGFIDDYMRFSSVLEPKTPMDFLASRSYTNGSTSYSAKPADREKLGEIVDKRLSELGLEPASNANHRPPAHLELRLKPISPTPVPDHDS